MERYRAESWLQQAQRRVDEVERHVAELKRLIAYEGALTEDAVELDKLLKIFEHSLELARQRVEIEKTIAETWNELARWKPHRRRSDRASGS